MDFVRYWSRFFQRPATFSAQRAHNGSAPRVKPPTLAQVEDLLPKLLEFDEINYRKEAGSLGIESSIVEEVVEWHRKDMRTRLTQQEPAQPAVSSEPY